MSTPEGHIKAKVKRAMAFYRFMPVQNGMGAPGLDFFYCCYGMFVAVETKTPRKKLTDRQRNTAENIAKDGGLVYVIRDEYDIRDMVVSIEVWGKASGPANTRSGVIYDKLGADHA